MIFDIACIFAAVWLLIYAKLVRKSRWRFWATVLISLCFSLAFTLLSASVEPWFPAPWSTLTFVLIGFILVSCRGVLVRHTSMTIVVGMYVGGLLWHVGGCRLVNDVWGYLCVLFVPTLVACVASMFTKFDRYWEYTIVPLITALLMAQGGFGLFYNDGGWLLLESPCHDASITTALIFFVSWLVLAALFFCYPSSNLTSSPGPRCGIPWCR